MATVTRHGWVPALPGLALNQYDRALEATQEALRLRPDDIPALVQLGATTYHQPARVRGWKNWTPMLRAGGGGDM